MSEQKELSQEELRKALTAMHHGSMRDGRYHLEKWMWWTKGECVVEVLRTGHFPTTAMVVMPNDKEIYYLTLMLNLRMIRLGMFVSN